MGVDEDEEVAPDEAVSRPRKSAIRLRPRLDT